ncbi:MAG: DMT family transporter [Bacteroidota bacterium]
MKRWQAHLAVFTANVIYGANYSIAKTVTPLYIKPFGFIVIRAWTAAILFWILGFLFPYEAIKRKDWQRIIICAIFGVAINQLMFFKGLSLTSPINAGLVMISNPVFVILLAFILYKEKITGKHLTGIFLGIIGCTTLILYGASGNKTTASPIGDLCIIINSFSYAVYLVAVKPIMKEYHPVTIMKWVFLIGSIIILPFGYNEFTQIQWSAFTLNTWMATTFVVIGSTFFAYLLNTIGLINLSASTVSVYIYLQPLLAAGFAIMLGKDSLNWIHVVSSIFIFSGVYLCIKRAEVN